MNKKTTDLQYAGFKGIPLCELTVGFLKFSLAFSVHVH